MVSEEENERREELPGEQQSFRASPPRVQNRLKVEPREGKTLRRVFLEGKEQWIKSWVHPQRLNRCKRLSGNSMVRPPDGPRGPAMLLSGGRNVGFGV